MSAISSAEIRQGDSAYIHTTSVQIDKLLLGVIGLLEGTHNELIFLSMRLQVGPRINQLDVLLRYEGPQVLQPIVRDP